MRYRAVVFDLDGTLLDTLGDILIAVNTMLKEQNADSVSYEQLKGMIGDGARKMIERAILNKNKDLDVCLNRYNQIYQNTTGATEPFEGIVPLLNHLKRNNILMSILSNKPQSDAEAIVKRVLKDFSFQRIIGQSEQYPVKPDTKGLKEIVKSFECGVSECLYVGDGEMDFITPSSIGMPVVSALWGYRTKQQLQSVGATEFLSTPLEVKKYF